MNKSIHPPPPDKTQPHALLPPLLLLLLQIVRLEGTNVEAGKKILKTSGIDIIAADDLDDAATKAVDSIRS
jgi:hypothetical protein